MKKRLLGSGIIILCLIAGIASMYSFTLNEQQIGRIELSKEGSEGVDLSPEAISYLVEEINQLSFKLFNKDLEVKTTDKGYEFAQEPFRIFVRDNQGKELADIRVYDVHNIACVSFLGPIRLTIGYHATESSLDLEILRTLIK